MNVLHIALDLEYYSGITRYINNLLTYQSISLKGNVYLITNRGGTLSNFKIANYRINGFSTLNLRFKYIFFIHNVVKIYRFCKAEKIQIIHTHHRYPELISVVVAKLLGIKTVITAHSITQGFRFLSFRSDQIIAISNFVKNHLENYYNVPNSKIITLYNCINFINHYESDNDTNESIPFPNLQSGNKVILFAGRFCLIKGIDILIESFHQLEVKNNKVSLILAGDFYKDRFFSKKLNFSKNIHIMKPVKNIEALFHRVDIVVLPSRLEPLGYLMLEAGYFKKPFIGSRTGGIDEFIEDGVNGYLFEPANSNELAEKINYVLQNPKEAKIAAEKLNQKVVNKCNCEKYFEKLISIYYNLLDN
jgi:glycosyltransferase involved in cell wall biosynthesis